MTKERRAAAAAREYATAHAAHYQAKDLRRALEIYRSVMTTHPGTLEAGYSRSQVRNIVKALVPEWELARVETWLALQHLEQVAVPDARRAPVMAIAPVEATG
jgi:hypothetical protein